MSTVDGRPAEDWLSRETALSSGTPRWKAVPVLWRLMDGAEGETITLGLGDCGESREVTLKYGSAPPPREKRPELIAELEPGIWYVDLSRATMADLTPQLETLATARAIVFDVRGYPTDAGAESPPPPRRRSRAPHAGCTWRSSRDPSATPWAGRATAGTSSRRGTTAGNLVSFTQPLLVDELQTIC